MKTGRRLLFQASAALVPVILAGSAKADTTDLVVSCDPAVAFAIRAAASAFTARSGVRVRLFPTSAGLIVPQLQHEVQNDLVVARLAVLDQAKQVDQLPSDQRAGPWHNPLVLAARPGAATQVGPVAVTDPSPASMLDGHAVLARMQHDAPSVIGAVDTGGVAFLLNTGAAGSGLMFMTDARENGFNVLATVPDDAAPVTRFAAALSRNARRPHPDAFLTFLASPEATAVLQAAGLEAVT